MALKLRVATSYCNDAGAICVTNDKLQSYMFAVESSKSNGEIYQCMGILCALQSIEVDKHAENKITISIPWQNIECIKSSNVNLPGREDIKKILRSIVTQCVSRMKSLSFNNGIAIELLNIPFSSSDKQHNEACSNATTVYNNIVKCKTWRTKGVLERKINDNIFVYSLEKAEVYKNHLCDASNQTSISCIISDSQTKESSITVSPTSGDPTKEIPNEHKNSRFAQHIRIFILCMRCTDVICIVCPKEHALHSCVSPEKDSNSLFTITTCRNCVREMLKTTQIKMSTEQAMECLMESFTQLQISVEFISQLKLFKHIEDLYNVKCSICQSNGFLQYIALDILNTVCDSACMVYTLDRERHTILPHFKMGFI